MPRSSRSSARPSARPAAPAAPAGARPASTAAYPAQHAPTPAPTHAPTHTSSGPGLLAQTASTMGGAMAGSVVGHGISNMLFGGSSAAPPPPSEIPAQTVQSSAPVNGASCDVQAKDFTKCLEATNGDMTSCSYYLEALKACQAAAAPY